MSVELQPTGSVAQMESARAVVSALRVIGHHTAAKGAAVDLILAWGTTDFQTELDAYLRLLRVVHSDSTGQNQAIILEIFPSLFQEADPT